jgi:hypothetical protein
MRFLKLISSRKNQDLVPLYTALDHFLSLFTDLARAWGKSHKKIWRKFTYTLLCKLDNCFNVDIIFLCSENIQLLKVSE